MIVEIKVFDPDLNARLHLPHPKLLPPVSSGVTGIRWRRPLVKNHGYNKYTPTGQSLSGKEFLQFFLIEIFSTRIFFFVLEGYIEECGGGC